MSLLGALKKRLLEYEHQVHLTFWGYGTWKTEFWLKYELDRDMTWLIQSPVK